MRSATEFSSSRRVARPDLVDITGGAPELYPRLAEMIITLSEAGLGSRVRTNLVSLLSPAASGLAEVFAEHGVALLGSFPSADPALFEAQRGVGDVRDGHRSASNAELPRVRRARATRAAPQPPTRPCREPGVGRDAGLQPRRARPAVAGPSRARRQLRRRRRDHERPGRALRRRARRHGRAPALPRDARRGNSTPTPCGCSRAAAASPSPGTVRCRTATSTSAPASCWPMTEPRTIFELEPGARGAAALAGRRIRFGTHCLACTSNAGSS